LSTGPGLTGNAALNRCQGLWLLSGRQPSRSPWACRRVALSLSKGRPLIPSKGRSWACRRAAPGPAERLTTNGLEGLPPVIEWPWIRA